MRRQAKGQRSLWWTMCICMIYYIGLYNIRVCILWKVLTPLAYVKSLRFLSCSSSCADSPSLHWLLVQSEISDNLLELLSSCSMPSIQPQSRFINNKSVLFNIKLCSSSLSYDHDTSWSWYYQSCLYSHHDVLSNLASNLIYTPACYIIQ